jgi:hypothetical protein
MHVMPSWGMARDYEPSRCDVRDYNANATEQASEILIRRH